MFGRATVALASATLVFLALGLVSSLFVADTCFRAKRLSSPSLFHRNGSAWNLPRLLLPRRKLLNARKSWWPISTGTMKR